MVYALVYEIACTIDNIISKLGIGGWPRSC